MEGQERGGGRPLHHFEGLGVGQGADQVLDNGRTDTALRHQLHDGGDGVAPEGREAE
jgi:hypothetical protein